MKFKYIFFAVALFLLAGVFVFYNKRDLGLRSSGQLYSFANLKSTDAAQVRFMSKELSAKSPFVISFEDILDVHYSSLVQKQEELFLASALEQYGLQAKDAIVIGQKETRRRITEICNQFGFRYPQDSLVKFNPLQDAYLSVDQKKIDKKDIKVESIAYKAAQSEVLDYLLSKINEKIRVRVLYLLAKENNQTVQDFVNLKIIRDEEVKEWAQKASVFYSQSESEQKAYETLLYQQHKDRMITDYIFKNHIQKPIVVNIHKPQFNFETRWEWTPFFGIAPRKNSVHVILFHDYFSEASRRTLKVLLSYRDKKIDYTVGFRPMFSQEDRMQVFLSEYLFCAWLKNSEVYWKLLESILNLKNTFSEEQVDELSQKVGLNVSELKKCSIARETKEIVSYHLKTAQHLRLQTTPTIFVGSEVRLGPVELIDFERILNRQ